MIARVVRSLRHTGAQLCTGALIVTAMTGCVTYDANRRPMKPTSPPDALSQSGGTSTSTSTGTSASASANSASLTGTAWRLDDLTGAGVVPKSEATLEFVEAGRVAGRGSCNRFFGTVTITGDAIKLGPIGATQMACVDAAVSKQEMAYFKALEAAERFTQQGDLLLIHVKGEEKPLRFSRKAPENAKP